MTPALALLSLAALLSWGCGSDGGSGGGVPREGGVGVGGSASGLPSCDALCPPVVAAGCSNGPKSQSDCVTGCQTIRGSKCAADYDAVYQCAGTSPRYSCDANGQVDVVGCETKMAALWACTATL